MRRSFVLIFLLLLLGTPSLALAATFTSSGSGRFDNGATWDDSVLGSSGTGDGEFQTPYSIAVAQDGSMYVANSHAGDGRIEKFDAHGNFVLKWGSEGTGAGQFDLSRQDYVMKLAIDSHGNVYVSDHENNRIQKFDSNGNFISMWGWGVTNGASALQVCTSGCQAGVAGTGNGQLDHPVGIAFDTSDNLYVVDFNNSRIQKFSSSGSYISKFDWQTSTSGNTAFIALDSVGNIYTAPISGRAWVKYNSSGVFVAGYGWGVVDGSAAYQICTSSCQGGIQGSGDGQLGAFPQGIAVDSNGYIYVSDQSNNRIQKFDSNGAFVTKWTGDQSPYNIALDPEGNILYGSASANVVYKVSNTGTAVAVNSCLFHNNCSAGADYPDDSDSAVVSSGHTVSIPASALLSSDSITISSGGTLSQGANSTLTVGGDWINEGTYTAGSDASVVLDGADQSIAGSTTFTNLSKTVSSEDILQFFPGDLTTITGALSLHGATSNLLSLEVGYGVPIFDSSIGASDVSSPYGVAIDTDGSLYVSDDDGVIKKFSSSGTLTDTIGDGDLSFPTDLSLDSDHNLYVIDGGNLRVYKYSPAGALLASWGADGAGGSTDFGAAYGLVVDGDRVYVSEYYAEAIYVFNLSGAFVNSFSTGAITFPGRLAVDSSHKLYVPSCGDDVGIGVFSESGTLERQFGQDGGADGPFECGWTIAVDGAGFVYVGDYSHGSKVHVFSSDGTFVTSFGSAGTGNGQFDFEEAQMAFDTEGNFYITDTSNNRVQKFAPNPDTDWQISASGSTSFSHLSISHSNNVGSTLSCTDDCTDGGNNTNWSFTAAAEESDPVSTVSHRSSSAHRTPAPVTPPPGPASVPPTTTPQTPALIGPSTPISTPITQYLVSGARSPSVLNLQKYLNSIGFIVATSGPGSPGNETSFFGNLTRIAVIKFQLAHGIEPTGTVGPITRKALNGK